MSEKQTQWAEMSKNRIEMCTGCSCLQTKLFKVCHLQSIIWYIPGYRGHSRSTTNTHIRDVVNPYDTRLFPMFSYSYNKKREHITTMSIKYTICNGIIVIEFEDLTTPSRDFRSHYSPPESHNNTIVFNMGKDQYPENEKDQCKS